jgi:hypothetical protein
LAVWHLRLKRTTKQNQLPHSRALFSQTGVKVEAAKNYIPTPMIKLAKALAGTTKKFVKPDHYLHFTNRTGAKMVTAFDQYDLLKCDVDWMNKYNTTNEKERYVLTEDALEAIIDLFEKQSYLVTQEIDPGFCYSVNQAQQDALDHLNIRGKVRHAFFGQLCPNFLGFSQSFR